MLASVLLGGTGSLSVAAASGSASEPELVIIPESDEEVADQDVVLFWSALTDWDSWYMNYLRQQEIVTQNPGGTDMTAGDLNDILNRVTRQVAQAFGAEAPEYQTYFTGPYTGYPYMAQGLAAFQEHCQSLNPWATAPNYELEFLRQVDEDEQDICLNDVFNFAAFLHKTECYIAQFDPEWYAVKGTDYLSPAYDPTRIGKAAHEIDCLVDYDFIQLAETTTQLVNIDRRRTLSAIFTRVTEGAETGLDKHRAMLDFLARAGFHGALQPLDEDGHLVEDPLVLLELGEMYCGHVARVACDLFSAGGYPSRLVQAGGHVLAEVYYDGSWHYFDADSNVIDPAMVDGHIPAMVELSQTPELADTTGNWWLFTSGDTSMDGVSTEYKASSYFSADTYTTPAQYIVKTATASEELNGSYGWNHYATVHDPDRVLYEDMPILTTPNAPALTAIDYDEEAGAYNLEWMPSNVFRGTLAGYRVFVSQQSRGWDWHTFYGDESLLPYRAREGYLPEDLMKIKDPLPCEIALLELDAGATNVTIRIEQGHALYVSLIAFDEHGEEVGNQLYPPSTEFLLTA